MEESVLSKLVKDKKSTWEISRILKVPQSSLRYWLDKYNLKTSPEKPHKCACGETDPTKFYGHKKKICGKCNNKYNTIKGQEKINKAIDYLGGKCVNPDCSGWIYRSSLDIHHIDKTKKDPHFNRKRGWSWDRLKKELDNCVLLCKNCHSSLHNGDWKIRSVG